VSDTGLEELSGLIQLEEINLYRTEVSNAGLQRLKQMNRLRALDLRYTRATRSGVEALRTGLPNCRITFLDVSSRQAGQPAGPELIAGKGEEAIARWVQSIGGKVILKTGRIEAISLASSPVSDLQLKNLQGLTGLRK